MTENLDFLIFRKVFYAGRPKWLIPVVLHHATVCVNQTNAEGILTYIWWLGEDYDRHIVCTRVFTFGWINVLCGFPQVLLQKLRYHIKLHVNKIPNSCRRILGNLVHKSGNCRVCTIACGSHSCEASGPGSPTCICQEHICCGHVRTRTRGRRRSWTWSHCSHLVPLVRLGLLQGGPGLLGWM